MSETIEILRQERDAARAELTARNDAFAERVDHQAATIDVLKAMSASPGELAQATSALLAGVRAPTLGKGSMHVSLYGAFGTPSCWSQCSTPRRRV